MRVRYKRTTGEVDEVGVLRPTIEQGGRRMQVVSIVTKYVYTDRAGGGYDLNRVIAACIPNGILQSRYNPRPDDTIWRAGRHSPKRGEEFRVRLHFGLLREKAPWRVRYIEVV